MKRVDFCFSFLGNPHTDSRITNIYKSLKEKNKSIKVIGFDWYNKNYTSPVDWNIYKIKRRPSLLFYLKFSLTLFVKLLNIDAQTFVAEDVYTLPIVTLIAKGRKRKLYYNSREFYTSIGGLAGKNSVQKLIAAIERFFIKYVDIVTVTGEMDKEFIEELYHPKKIIVIRNIPKKEIPNKIVNFHETLGISDKTKILLYQGMLLKGRGIFQSIESIKFLKNVALVLIGYGPEEKNIRYFIAENNLEEKVFLIGSVEHKELINYTSGADIGLALIENISTSYYYALPNKLFEYLNAGLCVICSPLPQMEKIVKDYEVGEIVNPENPADIAKLVEKLISDSQLLNNYKKNAINAAEELNWDVEFNKVSEYFE